MPRLNDSNVRIAAEIIGRYPRSKSALIPLLHLAQEQDGYVADDAMQHLAELLDITPAEVLGTCSFYEMFKREPVGDYRINICHGIACHLLGADDLIHHAEEALGCATGHRDIRWNQHRRCRVHRRLHRSALPAGQLSIHEQGEQPSASTRWSRTSATAPWQCQNTGCWP